MREKRWVFAAADRDASERLARSLHISPLTAQLLVNRGVRESRDAQLFLRPDLNGLHDPMLFNDMGRVVERVRRALRDGEKIAVFGDYDVDGTSGTAVLYKFFDLLAKPVTYRIPHRVQDGYGLNEQAIRDFAADGVKVLFTVDCGTSNVREIELAASLGIDVIVVDHHEAPAKLPPAFAIVNPKIPGSTYPFAGLCSVGLSFKVAWALSNGLAQSKKLSPKFRDFLLDAMGYVAMGTVADVCPIVGENRVFVTYGLSALRNCASPGVRGLLEKARLSEKELDTFDIGFRLAPRLNAVGRLGSAMDCVDLLVSRDAARIAQILEILETSNRKRKGIEDDIFEQALERVEQDGLKDDPVLVVADPRWHLGVVGIVAARLVDRFYRPAVVLAVDDGVSKGSCRSIEGFALHEALEACHDLLLTHGGHAMAAGCSLDTKNLVRFRERINVHAAQTLRQADLAPKLLLDDEVALDSMTKPVVKEIAMLAPHGAGNPTPLLGCSNVRLAGEPRLMGKKGDHISFLVTQGGPAVRAVGFGMGDLYEPLLAARTCSLAFTPVINEWNGASNVELKLEDVKF